jgi:hypothetical protein
MERKNTKSYNQQNRKETIRRMEMKEWWNMYLEILSQLITQINILVDFDHSLSCNKKDNIQSHLQGCIHSDHKA